MRVLHVIEKMDPKEGGVSQAVRTLYTGLAKKGVLNEVVSLDDPSAEFLKGSTIIIHALGPSKGPWRYSKTLKTWLVDNITRFDAVIIHGLWLYPSHITKKVIKAAKKQPSTLKQETVVPKLFVMPHGMLDPYFQQAAGRRLKAIRNWFYWKLIESDVINSADGIFFTCEMEMELARQPFKPYRPKQEKVVGLGVERPPEKHVRMEEMFRKKCPELKNEPYFLFLSRLHEKKGVDLLIEAFASITIQCTEGANLDYQKKHTNSLGIASMKIVIAGPGLDTPYGERLQQIVADSQFLKNNVYFTGMISGDEKWGAFYGCSAFILPSHQENFGIAVAEALACDKPVLISNQINIWREIETENGGIVEDDTLDGTKKLLVKWSSLSEQEKKNMGIRAGETYKKYFATETTTNSFYDAIS